VRLSFEAKSSSVGVPIRNGIAGLSGVGNGGAGATGPFIAFSNDDSATGAADMSSVLPSSQNMDTTMGAAAEIGAAVIGAAGGGNAMEKVSSFVDSQWNPDMQSQNCRT
jgi:hypothetical protein